MRTSPNPGSGPPARPPRAWLYRRIVRAKRFIDDHYAEPIDVDLVSEAAALSKFHFIRMFELIVGLTPRRYLTRVRLERARALLAEGATVTDACDAVGFQSLGSFSRAFLATYSRSPSTWRRDQERRRVALAAQPLAFVPGCFAAARGWST